MLALVLAGFVPARVGAAPEQAAVRKPHVAAGQAAREDPPGAATEERARKGQERGREDAAPRSPEGEPEAVPVPHTERVVVTATRIATPAGELGSSVTILTADDLAHRQTRLLADALREVPGLDVRRSGGPGSNTSVFMRGADADHTLVLLDGVEMNDPSSPNRLPFLDHLTTDGIDRVEIIRGPQSTLYGGDAIGGVISIITRKGSGPPQAAAAAEVGSFSTWRAALSSSGGTESFDYSVDASRIDSDSFSATSAGTEDDPFQNSTAGGRFGWDFSDRGRLDVVARHMEGKVAFDGFASEEGERIDSDQTLVKFEPRFASRGGRWSQRIGVQAVRHRRDTRGSFPTLIKGRLYTVDWGHEIALDRRHTMMVGVEAERQEAELPGFDDDASTRAFYVQDQFAFGGKIFGTVGIRVDDHSIFGTEATYRVTAARQFKGTGTTVRGSFGTGFKAPSLTELNISAFGGNPDLRAERSEGFDLGFEQPIKNGRHSLGATVFVNDIEDLIVAVFDAGSGTFLNLNVDDAEARGVEAAFTTTLSRSFSLAGSYTYTHTEAVGQPQGFGLSEGGSLLRRPRNKGSLDARLSFLDGRAGLTLIGLYVGERSDIDPVTFSRIIADDYVLFNLAGSYDVTEAVELFARIDNLLDEEYEDVLGFDTPDFSLYAGVRVRFR